jgi:hypothetical protein
VVAIRGKSQSQQSISLTEACHYICQWVGGHGGLPLKALANPPPDHCPMNLLAADVMTQPELSRHVIAIAKI